MLRLILVSFDIAVAWSSNIIQHVGLIIQHFEHVQNVGWPIQWPMANPTSSRDVGSVLQAKHIKRTQHVGQHVG